MNRLVLRAAFPSIAIETGEAWEGRASTKQPYFFDTVALTERAVAHRAKEMPFVEKILVPTHSLPGSPHWWTPIRNNVLEFAKLGPRNATQSSSNDRPVITYVSRQSQAGHGRSLDPKSHDSLVTALQGLEDKYGWEVNVARFEKLSKTEQILLAARTTVSSDILRLNYLPDVCVGAHRGPREWIVSPPMDEARPKGNRD